MILDGRVDLFETGFGLEERRRQQDHQHLGLCLSAFETQHEHLPVLPGRDVQPAEGWHVALVEELEEIRRIEHAWAGAFAVLRTATRRVRYDHFGIDVLERHARWQSRAHYALDVVRHLLSDFVWH